MTDIVERLRASTQFYHSDCELKREAIAEIERLQMKAARLREALRLADAALRGANMNLRAVEVKVRAALVEDMT